MRSIRGFAVATAATLTAGLAPAGPASASTTAQWHETFSTKGYTDSGTTVAVSPDGKTVFATGDASRPVDDTGSAGIFAYDAATGAVRWKASLDRHPGTDDNGFSSIAVSPGGSTVFASGYSGDANKGTGIVQAIVAYNAATGAKRWEVIGTVHGGPLSPLQVSPSGTTLFVTDGDYGESGQTAAYNAATGALLWSVPAGGQAITLSANASTLYVTGEPSGTELQGDTEAFNAATGAEIWQASESGSFVNLTGMLLSPDGKMLFVAGGSETSASTRSFVVAYSASSGTPLWTTHTGAAGAWVGLGLSPHGSSVIVTESISARSSSRSTNWVTLALNPATGATRWKMSDPFKHDGPIADAYAMSPDGSIAYISGAAPEDTAKYLTIGFSTGNGKPVWSASYGELARNYPSAMAVGPDGGQVFVTGVSNSGPAADSIMTTVAYPTT